MQLSDLLLTNEVAVVTGGARGIGKAIAETLASFGAKIVIADVLGDLGEETAQALRANGHEAVAIETDVRDEAQVRRLISRSVDEMGGIDILVNNAGGTFSAPFLQVNRRGYDMMIDLNLTSVWVATQAVVEHWIAAKTPGRVINVATTEGLKACPGRAAYSAAKAGVINLTKTLAAEVGPYGIRINCIAPDYTNTPGVFRPGPESEARNLATAELSPLKRYGEAEDHAGPVLFFASKLSAWVTGQTLIVDGGAWWAARVEGAFPFTPQDQPSR